MEYQNLKHLQDCLYFTQNICSWSMTPDGMLLYSNCPEQDFFFSLFSVSRCREEILKHFKGKETPILAADRIGFVWIAAVQPAEENQNAAVIHMAGPVFTSSVTEQYIRGHMRSMSLSHETGSQLWSFIRTVPAIGSDQASRFAAMLHYTVGKSAVSPNEVEIWSEPAEQAEGSGWGDANWHGDWTAERQFFDSIAQGRYVDLSRITTGQIGQIGGGDPLRQAKNQVIVLAVICSRAAITGGVSVEGSLALCDYFINAAEAEKTIPAVESVGMEMYRTYIQRVQRVREEGDYSPLIRACSEYVESHIFEKIRLADLAASVGYTETYISRAFKKEAGESLSDYINHRKTELAKRLLREHPISVAELSERLAYTSPSYFSSVFKKFAGVSPAEYQSRREEE